MTPLQQKRHRELEATLERAHEQRDDAIRRLVRCDGRLQMLLRAKDRLEKAMAKLVNTVPVSVAEAKLLDAPKPEPLPLPDDGLTIPAFSCGPRIRMPPQRKPLPRMPQPPRPSRSSRPSARPPSRALASTSSRRQPRATPSGCRSPGAQPSTICAPEAEPNTNPRRATGAGFLCAPIRQYFLNLALGVDEPLEPGLKPLDALRRRVNHQHLKQRAKVSSALPPQARHQAGSQRRCPVDGDADHLAIACTLMTISVVAWSRHRMISPARRESAA